MFSKSISLSFMENWDKSASLLVITEFGTREHADSGTVF